MQPTQIGGPTQIDGPTQPFMITPALTWIEHKLAQVWHEPIQKLNSPAP